MLVLTSLSLVFFCSCGASDTFARIQKKPFEAELRIKSDGITWSDMADLRRYIALFERNYLDENNGGEAYKAYQERLMELVDLSGGAFNLEMANIDSARGMALDLAVESAREGGASSFLLELGGTIYAAGTKTSAAPWRVSVGNESTVKKSTICSIPLCDRALAAVEATGTGEIREVAVAAPSALAAEVFADVLLGLGPASWKRLLTGMPGFDAVFITVDGYILASSGIYPFLNLESENYEVLLI